MPESPCEDLTTGTFSLPDHQAVGESPGKRSSTHHDAHLSQSHSKSEHQLRVDDTATDLVDACYFL